MRKLTIDNLYNDLTQWAATDAVALNEAVALSNNAGWEQWCVVQFLRWQHHQPEAAQGVNFHREWREWNPASRRRYDIVYNSRPEPDAGGYPVLVTQWKAMKENVSYNLFEDIGTLSEINTYWEQHQRAWLPVLVGLTIAGAEFPGARELPTVPAADVRLYISTAETWKPFYNRVKT